MSVNKVHILDCGSLSLPLEWLVPEPQYSRRAALEPDPQRFACSPHAILVDTTDGLILWDTACPRDWATYWPEEVSSTMPYDQVDEERYFDSRLAQLGVKPSDVDYVVLSHLHFDHAGNAKMFADTGSRFIVQEIEKEWAHDFDEPYFHAHYKPDYDSLSLETISGDVELVPGVELLLLPGHTPGTMGMKVNLPNSGPMIFTSDAVFVADNYGPPAAPPPHQAWVTPEEADVWLQSVERLRKIADESEAKVVFGHDSAQLRTLRLAPDGYYD